MSYPTEVATDRLVLHLPIGGTPVNDYVRGLLSCSTVGQRSQSSGTDGELAK